MRTIAFAFTVAALTAAGVAQDARVSRGDLRFEVAAIRHNHTGALDSSFRVLPNGQLIVTNSPLLNIVRNAYEVQRSQIIPGPSAPDWFDSDRWDIVAKAPEGANSRPEVLQMLRDLLADRFKLVARREPRDTPVSALVLAREDGRLGPDIRRPAGPCNAAGSFCGRRTGPTHVSARSVTLAEFAAGLNVYTGRTVIDRTGLSGPYDLELQWTDGASLFTAIREQLGLKLEPARAAVEVLVVQRAERPTEN